MNTTAIENKDIDPMTLKELNPGDRVTLTAPSGVKNDFIIERIAAEKDILLVKSRTQNQKIKANTNTVIIHPRLVIGAFKLSPGDRVTVVGPRGQKIPMKVSLLLDKKALILVPINRPEKIGFFDKIRLFWAK